MPFPIVSTPISPNFSADIPFSVTSKTPFFNGAIVSRNEGYAVVQLKSPQGKSYRLKIKGDQDLLADDAEMMRIAAQGLGLTNLYSGKLTLKVDPTQDQTTVERLETNQGETSPRLLFRGNLSELDQKIAEQCRPVMHPDAAPAGAAAVPAESTVSPHLSNNLSHAASPTPAGSVLDRNGLLDQIRQGTALKPSKPILTVEDKTAGVTSNLFKELLSKKNTHLKKIDPKLIKDHSCGVLDPNRKRESENSVAQILLQDKRFASRYQAESSDDEDDDDDIDL